VRVDTAPRFPDDPDARSGVAILGCGTIAQSAHLPAYAQHGVGVTGVWSRTPATTADVRARFPGVGRIYPTADELLADPEVRYVDIATGPEGRLDWIEAAVEAGKHVLAQKPVTLSADDLARLPDVLARAAEAGVRVAVNHNGRWAPPWRATTLLVREGAIGEVVGVTHLHDKPLPPLAGSPFDHVPHMLLTDYLLHWVDITRGWLADGGAGDVTSVQAVDSRVPGQPAEARNPWAATLSLATRSGATATLRITGSNIASEPGCPFWVHGTSGTLRGSVLLDSDRLELDDGATRTPVELQGAWFVDGFAAAMGELMCAVAEDRGPENSATDAARSVALVLAARDSAERGGRPVEVDG
jgi:predicted dehydrogenase